MGLIRRRCTQYYRIKHCSNRNSVTHPTGQKTAIEYDELDWLGTLSYANTCGAGPLGYEFGYDPENNLTSVAEKLTH